MKKLFTFLLYAMMIIAVGCTESFDDSKIWDKLNSLENRVEALEQLCRQMNTNISSLQTVVNALQNNDYVTNIAPITEDGKVIGYTITFSKSGAVTIYHGKDGKDGTNGADGADGKDGYTPVIGVAKDSDGIYYWTLDGDWLLDKDGNKIKAEGRDGKDGQNGANGNNGQDGITPKLKIENDNWYISYDNGSTWTELGKATDEDGDSMFKDVTYDDEYVYFTLTDGTILTVPLVDVSTSSSIPSTQIWYTSTDEKVVTPKNKTGFGANITNNVYENGKGVITFDGDIISIGKNAFYECTKLKSITIPNGVTSIGQDAFSRCTSLENISLPNGVISIGQEAFSDCSSLTSISIPKGVTSIESSTFRECRSLANVTIPDGVTSINGSAFQLCSSLTKVTIPEGTTSIGGKAFYGCSSLASVFIPETITSIGQEAFYDCVNLINITIPKGITSIANSTFYNCSSLIYFTIPDGVTSIGNSAFENCSSLINITLPEGITSIGYSAFKECI